MTAPGFSPHTEIHGAPRPHTLRQGIEYPAPSVLVRQFTLSNHFPMAQDNLHDHSGFFSAHGEKRNIITPRQGTNAFVPALG